ncbi:MAG: biopolymer transporter ExbD [Pseudomonadota bacterium]
MINNDDESNDGSLIGEINVTPMVDVTLVLLIIFIVTATYIIARSIPVDLPKASTGEEITSPIAITITKDGSIYYEGTKVSDLNELKSKVKKAKESQKDVRAVIAADKDIKHGKFVAVVNIIREAGIARFAINIKEEDIIQ